MWGIPGMDHHIVTIFCPSKPTQPFVGLITCKAIEVLFMGAINHFGLVIYLKMIIRVNTERNPLHLKQNFSQSTNENLVTITSNGL